LSEAPASRWTLDHYFGKTCQRKGFEPTSNGGIEEACVVYCYGWVGVTKRGMRVPGYYAVMIDNFQTENTQVRRELDEISMTYVRLVR
jgi:hypothetical protein